MKISYLSRVNLFRRKPKVRKRKLEIVSLPSPLNRMKINV